MEITRVTPELWRRARRRILRFVAYYRDRHITVETSAKFNALTSHLLNEDGTLVLVATHEDELIGVLACKNYGKEFSLAVVRRGDRSKGVGKAMLRKALEDLNEFQVEIAADNVPSLSIAFACGLLAYGVFVRDTGKIVLKLKKIEVPA